MRVALFTDGISPYVLGGMQRHSFFVCKHLARQQVGVDLYHFNQSEYDIHKLEFFTDEEKKYIRAFVIPFPKTIWFPGHYLFASWKYSKHLFEQFIRNGPVDFIYAKGFTAWYLLKHKKKIPFKVPPVGVKFHGMNMFMAAAGFRQYLEQRMLRPPVRWIMHHADYVFSYGGQVSGVIRRAGVAGDKIIEIPTGIGSEWLKKPEHKEEHLRFLYVGRYERLKGIEELYRAFREISTPNNKWEFHLVGPIPEHKRINHPCFIYHGETRDEKKLQDIMDKCHVLLCPSYSEGMPNVILEGMARGMAILATDTGAVSELVGSENGWLLPAPRVEWIKEKILDILKEKSSVLYEKRKASFEKVSNHFLWEHIAGRLKEAIKKGAERAPF